MKYARISVNDKIIPAVVDSAGSYRSIADFVSDISPQALSSNALPRLSEEEIAQLELVQQGNIEACISNIPNFYCIGLNYRKEDAPHDLQASDKVLITSKATTAVCGAQSDIQLPRDSIKTDWEVELGVIISKPAWQISYDDALDYVFGYCVVNDVCERDYMFEHGGQWIKGKSAPSFGPIGPWLVSKDEVENPQDLDLWLKVNGEVKQDSNTKNMISDVRKLVSHMSHYLQLVPGDLIATGTPPGIGMHRNPPEFLRRGDILELSVQGLGSQKSTVV